MAAIPQVSKVTRLTASGLVFTGHVYLAALLIGTDGTNDPVVAVYDDVDGDTAGNKIIPANTYDASALGLNGVVFPFMLDCTTGIYVTISDLGTGEVMVAYREVD